MRYIATLIACTTLIPLFANNITVAKITHFGYCGDSPSGAIDIEVIDGISSSYTYLWSGPDEFEATTQDIEGLYPGEYSVTVTDALCGVATLENIVIECEGSCPDIMDVSLEELTDCICEGQGQQVFEVEVTGTSAPYTFQWSGPNFTSTEQNPSNVITAGVYHLTVTNSFGCAEELNAILGACTPIESLEFEIIQSCGGQTGHILTTVTGGVIGGGGYDFNWSNKTYYPISPTYTTLL